MWNADMDFVATSKALYRSVSRNKQPILEVLQQYIPVGTQGLKVFTVKENGGGHVSYFAAAYPGIQFQPTSPAPELLESMNAHCEGLSNVRPARQLHPVQEDWCLTDNVDVIITCNLVQVVPWEATVGLLQGAGKYLNPGGRLFIYGPFMEDGQYASGMDEAIDMSLRVRNPSWGYRDLAEVVAAAEARGLHKEAIHDMPDHHFMLVFRKVS